MPGALAEMSAARLACSRAKDTPLARKSKTQMGWPLKWPQDISAHEQVPQNIDVHAVQRVDVLDPHALVDLVDRRIHHPELHDLSAERGDEAPIGRTAAG